MTQEIKDKLEQTARDYIKPFAHQLHLGAEEGLIIDLVGFAQTILNNPGEWGLMPILDGMQHIQDPDSDCNDALSDLKAENTRFREALEAIKFMCDANDPSHEKFWRLAFNATKKDGK